jgi:uncharacterized membrane protein YecN with MAPEG domain
MNIYMYVIKVKHIHMVKHTFIKKGREGFSLTMYKYIYMYIQICVLV